MKPRLPPFAACWGFFLFGLDTGTIPAAPPPIDSNDHKVFADGVGPIFLKHCGDCHNPQKHKADLDLTRVETVLHGSRSGPVVAAGKAKESLLYQVLQPGSEPHMPPQKQLAKAEIDAVAVWIDGLNPSVLGKGEKVVTDRDRQFWSFAPLRRPPLPTVKQSDWPCTPVDAFIVAQLEAKGLGPASPASKLALIRRATFDLTGLPPTQAEVGAFLVDDSAQGYEKLIDRLLTSPRYGERWGRHWLDLARYADSDGFEFDVDRPNAYHYRDYVIRSFNADKPYNRFILEQLAGDELAPGDPEALIGTGFCRNGPTIDNQKNEKNRLDELDDVLSTTGAVFLGLTLGCARCHDHKYDPIPQRDYYRMLAIFNNCQKQNLAVETAEERARNRELAARINREIDALKKQLAALPASGGKAEELKQRIKKWEDSKPALKVAQCIVEAGARPRPTYLLVRGDHRMPANVVQPGVPSVLARRPVAFLESPKDQSSGRRLRLAHWIADAENPLTARVMVNRLWQYHFGRGLVETSSNFGSNGSPPTHPELLDWLATEFARRGWSVKAMHRLMMLSAVYQQSSHFEDSNTKVDPENRYLWRFSKRRLEAEAIRDAILQASGTLNQQMYGPGVRPRIHPSIIATGSTAKWPTVKEEGPQHWRRSTYIFVKRSVLMPMMESFDAPTSTQTCERRIPTTVAPQALQLLNGRFTNEQAAFMARRILQEAGDDLGKQMERVYWLTLSRPPTEKEQQMGVEFLREQKSADPLAAVTDFCQVMFNLNEFVYVD